MRLKVACTIENPEPGTLLSRRRGENPRVRFTDAVEIPKIGVTIARCQVSAWTTVAVPQGIQPQRKKFMAGLAERAPQAHTGDSLISVFPSNHRTVPPPNCSESCSCSIGRHCFIFKKKKREMTPGGFIAQPGSWVTWFPH